MKPRSILHYYLRNKLRLAPIFAVLALAVFGISLTGVLTGTIQDAGYYRVEAYRHLAQISPAPRAGNWVLDAVVKGDLRRDPNVQHIL